MSTALSQIEKFLITNTKLLLTRNCEDGKLVKHLRNEDGSLKHERRERESKEA